jgi:hypothetical protein
LSASISAPRKYIQIAVVVEFDTLYVLQNSRTVGEERAIGWNETVGYSKSALIVDRHVQLLVEPGRAK